MRIPGRRVIERTGVDNWTDITRDIVIMRWWPAGIAGSVGGCYHGWGTGVGGFSFPKVLVEGLAQVPGLRFGFQNGCSL